VEVRDDALDRAVLARGVAALEQHYKAPSGRDDPLLHVDELRLQAQQLLVVLLDTQLSGLVHARMIPGPRRRARLRAAAPRRSRAGRRPPRGRVFPGRDEL